MQKPAGRNRLARLPDTCSLDLISSARPAELAVLADHDLWSCARPGLDHQFDADRFGEWLEVLADAGEVVAARAVATLDRDLVVAGLSRYVRVFDPGIFEPIAQSDDEAIDRTDAMHEGGGGQLLECEVGGYIVRARRSDAWDAIVMVMTALETGHESEFHDIMQGCRRLSNSQPERDGLHDLLMAADQQIYNVAIDRDRRRSQLGYVTPADARAFLQMARQPGRAGVNPIATASFRDSEEAAMSDEYFAGVRELAFLANVLIEGCSIQGRPFTPQEAANAVAGTCKLGLEHKLPWPGSRSTDNNPIAVFEAGWSRLHQDVSVFVAEQLTLMLDRLRVRDLEELDPTASVAVAGLLGECPVLPAALTAILDGRTTAVSPTAFDFIATSAQISEIRAFMRVLPTLLSVP